jgi:hypothetical protein
VVILDGKNLADVVMLDVAWQDLSTALQDTGVECSQAVSPSAKPSCNVTADPQH